MTPRLPPLAHGRRRCTGQRLQRLEDNVLEVLAIGHVLVALDVVGGVDLLAHRKPSRAALTQIPSRSNAGSSEMSPGTPCCPGRELKAAASPPAFVAVQPLTEARGKRAKILGRIALTVRRRDYHKHVVLLPQAGQVKVLVVVVAPRDSSFVTPMPSSTLTISKFGLSRAAHLGHRGRNTLGRA